MHALAMSARSGPIQKQAKTGDSANAAATAACLPYDLLASILVRLPASDLRRFRGVCKEWREIISSHAFIDDHLVHGPRTLTHTVVFFPGQPCGTKFSDHGSGFLFDGRWRLTATFSAPRFDEMIGQCNGLLCFLDGCHRNRAMHIVEPFSGESHAVPLPPRTERWREHVAYCFGFDPNSRRYKIFHQGQGYNVTRQDLYVYTVGEGENWRRVQVAGEKMRGVYHGDPVFANGSVYWYAVTGGVGRLTRFDMGTEEVTSDPVATEEVTSESVGFLRNQVYTSSLATSESIGFFGQERTALAVITDSDAGVPVMTMTLPHGRRLARPHGLQREQLLLNDYHDGGLYAHTIAPASNDLGRGELLLDTLEEERPAKGSARGLFVPVQVNQKRASIARNKDRRARVFCYAPPVSLAPLAHFFGKL